MNIDKLKRAEEKFLRLYPNGFADEGMAKIVKRHKMGAMTNLARESFSASAQSHVDQTTANIVKIASRS